MHLIFVILAVFSTSCFADERNIVSILPKGDEHIRTKGDNYALTCLLSVSQANLISNFRWLDPRNQTIDKNYLNVNKRFWTQTPQPNQLMLIITKLDDGDVGRYTCAADYDTKPVAQSVFIKTILSITFLDAPEDQLAKQGDKKFKLKCKVQAQPNPTVAWNRNGHRLINGGKYILDTDGLIIQDVQESDDGEYSCDVLVPETGEYKVKAIHLEVISDPVIQPTLRNVIDVVEGEKAVIQCNATGKPYPSISWIKKATHVNLTTNWDGRLVLEKVTKEDDDTFICVASNKANVVQWEVKLNVQSKPHVVEVVNSTIVAGRNGQLLCFVYGNPEPNVTIRKMGFKHHGQNYDTNDVRLSFEKRADPKGRHNTVLGILKFDHVEKTDDGLYECVASNGIGETIGNLHLTVEYKPIFERSAMVNRVVTWNQKPVNLTCVAQAIPNATITWYYGTHLQQLDKSSRPGYAVYTNTGKSILQVKPLESSYYGPYKCKAVNQHGEDYYEIKLEEGFRPKAVSQVKVNTTTATTTTFEFFDSPSSGNMPIKGYKVECIRSTEDWSRASQKVWPIGGPYILTDLKPLSKYRFRFAAINEVGDSPWGGFIDVETPMISPPSEPVIFLKPSPNEKYIKSSFAQKIELRWIIPSNNGLSIDEYAIRICRTTEDEIDGLVPEHHEDCTPIKIPYSEVLSSYMIEGLNPNTLYQVQLAAHNSEGFSQPSVRFYKTNVTIETYEKMQNSGLSSVVIIYIVVAILIGFLVIIDIFCFFISKTGVIYTLCGGCCIKKKKNDDKLGSESRDLITNGLKNKVDIEEQSPMITDGTKKETAVEYDVKKGTSKTGFVGKDSAV